MMCSDVILRHSVLLNTIQYYTVSTVSTVRTCLASSGDSNRALLLSKKQEKNDDLHQRIKKKR